MFTISPKANENYLAKFVKINNLNKHPDADRLQVTTIDGCTVITGMDAKLNDIVVYFPLECTINFKFLAATNSFEDKELNVDKNVKGFFNKYGRVRAVKLRKQPSMGYIVPVKVFLDWLSTELNTSIDFSEDLLNKEFDCYKFSKDMSITICKKYITTAQKVADRNEKQRTKAKYSPQKQSKIVDNQFRLHCDTPQLAKNMHNITPEDIITITAKLHGTSAVFSNVLCKKQLKWYEKLLLKLGVNLATTVYDNLYSSRKVIKNRFYNDKKISDGYYKEDIWGVVNKEVKEYLSKGMTVYGEVVGFLENGNYIQNKYDYGCNPKEHQLYIYRITSTNADGEVVEWSSRQVQQWCQEKGLKAVPLYYEGKAKDLFNIEVDTEWSSNFLKALQSKYLEADDVLCKNKVPDEGICLRREGLSFDTFKLKSYRFFEFESKELDNGVLDIETEESVSE